MKKDIAARVNKKHWEMICELLEKIQRESLAKVSLADAIRMAIEFTYNIFVIMGLSPKTIKLLVRENNELKLKNKEVNEECNRWKAKSRDWELKYKNLEETLEREIRKHRFYSTSEMKKKLT